MHFEVCFFKLDGAGARARGHGTLFEVDFRGKSLEHAMHPQGGRRIFKGFAPAAGFLASCFVKAGEVQVCSIVRRILSMQVPGGMGARFQIAFFLNTPGGLGLGRVSRHLAVGAGLVTGQR